MEKDYKKKNGKSREKKVFFVFFYFINPQQDIIAFSHFLDFDERPCVFGFFLDGTHKRVTGHFFILHFTKEKKTRLRKN